MRYRMTLRGQDRILEIVRLLGGTHYVNAPGGRDLYDAAEFERRGIELRFLPPFAGRTNSMLYEFCFHPIRRLARRIAGYGLDDVGFGAGHAGAANGKLISIGIAVYQNAGSLRAPGRRNLRSIRHRPAGHEI